MKTFQTLMTISALTIAINASGYTEFDVSYTPQSLNFLGSTVPLSGTGAGKAILDDNGLLSMTLQGELIADASLAGFEPGNYMDLLIGSTFQIMTTSSGNGSVSLAASPYLFYPLSSDYSTQVTSCGYGALETIFVECSLVDRSAQRLVGPSLDGYTYNFYSDQSFTLDGGSLNIQTSLFSAQLVSFLAAFELTPTESTEPEPPAATVPEPLPLSLLIPGLIMLATFGRRKAALV